MSNYHSISSSTRRTISLVVLEGVLVSILIGVIILDRTMEEALNSIVCTIRIIVL